MRRLFEARQRLRDLLTKLDGNDDLDKLLRDVIVNTEGLQEIKSARPQDAPQELPTVAANDDPAPAEPQA